MDGNKVESLPAATTAERVEDNSQELTTELENASINDSSFIQAMIKAPSGFKLDDRGVFLVNSNNEEGKQVSSPIWATAVTEDTTDKTNGVVLNWVDLRGSLRNRAIPMDYLYDSGSDFIKYLGRSGVKIDPSQTSSLKRYLVGFLGNLPFVESVTKLGWIEGNEELAYVLPHRVIGAGYCKEDIIYQPERHSYTGQAMYESGGFYDWTENVAHFCSQNPMLVFGLSLGFSGMLLHFSDIETGGFNIYGRSSGGKTTVLQVAASVVGNGSSPGADPSKSYVLTWNSTSNALEALASSSNDGLLCLDEIHTCNDNDFGRVVYNLSGGRGKQRLSQDADIKKSRSWRSMILSSGEQSVREKILQTSKNVHSGQALRLIDIPANDEIIKEPKGYSYAEFADRLKNNCSKYFGVAGSIFIDQIIIEFETQANARKHINELNNQIHKELLLPNMEREQQRALKRFSLVATAGILASRLGVLPLEESEIISSVRYVVGLWLSDDVNLPRKVINARMVREAIERNQSRFQLTNNVNDVPPKDMLGYFHEATVGGHQQKLYLFTTNGFAEVCNGQNINEVAKDLKEMGFLQINDSNRLKSKHSIYINGVQRRSRFYSVPACILSFDELESIRAGEDGANGTLK